MQVSEKPKRLKLKKSFTPPLCEDGDEYFPNGFFEFNISKLLSYIGANRLKFPLEEISVKEYATFERTTLNEATIERANLESPIVIAEISPRRFNVIDGNHRLERAKREGLEKLPAYRVSAEHHIPFLTSLKAYEAYVRYWNAKVDDWEP